MVWAVEQPDIVGPEGEFEKSVSDIMDSEKNMPIDVAEMLVAAHSLYENDPNTKSLNRALRAMDKIQRAAGELYDSMYDDYLDLYPSWRFYIKSKDPIQQELRFKDYEILLDRFFKGQEEFIQNLGYLITLQKALLPSNAYVDPYNRIAASSNIEVVLENFS